MFFVTGYDEYMPRAFGKNVIGFVQKPIEEFDIFMSLKKAVRLINAGKLVGFEDGTEISSEKDSVFFCRSPLYQSGAGRRQGESRPVKASWRLGEGTCGCVFLYGLTAHSW